MSSRERQRLALQNTIRAALSTKWWTRIDYVAQHCHYSYVHTARQLRQMWQQGAVERNGRFGGYRLPNMINAPE